MSTLKVNTIRHTGASSDAVTLATDGTCTAKITNNLSNRNLIINGAMQVAQRGTSSTGHGMECIDRWNHYREGVEENPVFVQSDVASGTAPYQKGFRKTFKVINGNQTSGAGGDDYITIDHKIEAQDIANSGWDYTSTSSYITLSFWVKSSVAQIFYGYLKSQDGTAKSYPFSTGSLSADTWTKVTKTIPGVSGLQFDNDNGHGLQLRFLPFRGVNKTDPGVTLDAWGNWNNTARVPDISNTWYNTNDATFEITGVQLEVGEHATDFEHRSYGDELARCHRYYYKHIAGNNLVVCLGFSSATNQVSGYIQFPTTMRATPSIDHTSGDNYYRLGAGNLGGDKYVDGAWALQGATDQSTRIYATPQSTLTAGEPGLVDTTSASASMAFSAEL